jgi:hypothetical protein
MSLVWLVVFAIVVAAAMSQSGGHLLYTLDDPYIHLAVAENIIRGVYGINLTEFSSPSSSVAFPLMLALTEAVRLGSWGPLIINAAAAAATVYVTGLFLRDAVFPQATTPFQVAYAYVIGGLTILVESAVALPMTGLEHMCHVLLVVLNLFGLHRIATGHRVPWLIVTVAALPLLRFEGIAMAGAMIAVLFALGHRRKAVSAAVLVALALGAYFSFMHALGLPLMPSSVLLKSALTSAATGNAAGAHGGIGSAVIGNFRFIARTLPAQTFVLLVILILAGLVVEWRTRRRPTHLAIGFVGLATVAAHLAGGNYGWFARYEVYAGAAGVLAALVTYRDVIGATGTFAAVARVATLLTVALVASSYVMVIFWTPAASRNVYEQQYQMGRFITEDWQRPVAVNDLGWTSYRNDGFVLDLFGLGSEPVRRLRASGKLDAAAIDGLVRENGIQLAIIYDGWFKDSVPKSWRKVAVLHTSKVTAAYADVSFYATQPAVSGELVRALDRFKPTLPAGARLEMLPATPGPGD